MNRRSFIKRTSAALAALAVAPVASLTSKGEPELASREECVSGVGRYFLGIDPASKANGDHVHRDCASIITLHTDGSFTWRNVEK
jgi:hypothetical protein